MVAVEKADKQWHQNVVGMACSPLREMLARSWHRSEGIISALKSATCVARRINGMLEKGGRECSSAYVDVSA